MTGVFIRKFGVVLNAFKGENKRMGITQRKLSVKMDFEDEEFDDLCEVVQSIYGSASVTNIESHIKRSLMIYDAKIVKDSK